MERKYRYSLIIPVYNEISGISIFMESLYTQTSTPDEIIIVDGGSTDGTYEYLLEEAKTHNINVFSFPSNIAEARNFAIKNAKNDIILCTDSGCKIDKDRCKELINVYESTDELVVGGKSELLSDTEFSNLAKKRFISPDPDFHFVSSRNISFHKSIWESVHGYPEYLTKWGEDTYFNYKIEKAGNKIFYNPNAIVSRFMAKDMKGFYKLFRNYTQGDFEVLMIHGINQSTSIKQALVISIVLWVLLFLCILLPVYIPVFVIGFLFSIVVYKRSGGGLLFDLQFSLAKLFGLFIGAWKGILAGYRIKKTMKSD